MIDEEEEEWSRRRRLLDEEENNQKEDERESIEAREAYALDRAMEERRVARKASGSSLSSGSGMGPAWRARFVARKRTGSVISTFTSGSAISEDLIEEEEKEDLLGVGGGFDAPSISSRSHSGETTEEEAHTSPDAQKAFNAIGVPPTPSTAKVPSFAARRRLLQGVESVLNQPPPSAPPTKTSFGMPPRPLFKPKGKTRPPPLSLLPTVPSSPDIVVQSEASCTSPPKDKEPIRKKGPPPALKITQESVPRPIVVQAAPRRPRLQPLRNSNSSLGSRSSSRSSGLSQFSQSSSISTPSQTLFVFPPSPTLKAKTPHMVTVTSNLNTPNPFSPAPTPRVSSFQSQGKRRSFIGLSVPPTPTTACSRVDARGVFGIGSRVS
jgi:tyrosine-protein phosphatase MSG5